ncbi:pre-mRNA-splicing factor CWC25-like isoform X2 [Nylanderia fulva]|uniref:pre-mRNA-splicing factor CWC25-like isoform X2 n=1 Tax=Nylanderia fulva TaxID=613905 RepID=UPI0010FB9743|nr:pre-mRNA-splicing factor CWC25-like isoform X2 [Nylanderia fulva]
MNPTRSTNVRRYEESRSARNEDHDVHSILRSRTEEEKQRRRREWQRQQERERQHEKLKQEKIKEYELKRAKALGYAEHKFSHRSRSKSGSKSPPHYQHRGRSATITSKPSTLFEKLDGSTSGSLPLFKGPEGIQISTTELRRIKVDIHRNIPTKGPIVTELQRSILNAEDVVLKRRDGEGTKPIFDREEIKKAVTKTNEVEERRTVVAVDGEQSVLSKPQTSKKRSSSPTYSPGYLSSHQSRYRTDLKRQDNRTEFRDHHQNNGSSIEKRREYKEKYAERDAHKYNTNRSRSRERDSGKSHSRSMMEERSYRDRYRDRSSEHSRERRDRDRDRDKDRDRDRSKERRDVTPHYIEPPIHVPIYYNLPPRPIVVGPMVPFRGQVPPMGRGRHVMAPVRPFPPRFIPPDLYRLGPPPPNPRYGPF